jgi:hypothetical protein
MGWQGGSDEQRFGGVEEELLQCFVDSSTHIVVREQFPLLESTLKVFKKTSSPYLGLGRRVWQT